MLIGILSDSHGDHGAVRRAVEIFDGLGVEHIIHCGDVGGIGVLDELVGRPCTLVWGNMDRAGDGLRAYADKTGISVPAAAPATLQLDGRSVAVFHGHEPGFEAAVIGLDVDYLFHGHTHRRRDQRIGRTRVINPGALHRVRVQTVATLDTTTDKLRFFELGNL